VCETSNGSYTSTLAPIIKRRHSEKNSNKKMKTENKLEKLVKELNYWKVDYETKMAENTTKSIKFCIDALAIS